MSVSTDSAGNKVVHLDLLPGGVVHGTEKIRFLGHISEDARSDRPFRRSGTIDPTETTNINATVITTPGQPNTTATVRGGKSPVRQMSVTELYLCGGDLKVSAEALYVLGDGGKGDGRGQGDGGYVGGMGEGGHPRSGLSNEGRGISIRV